MPSGGGRAAAERAFLPLLGLVAVVWGSVLASRQAWTCDDAFISFRYARHLAEGHGLVFNPGEWVEGYSNLLWTVWAAVGIAAGIDPESWARIWSLLAHAGTVALLTALGLRWRREARAGPFLVPVAALGLAVWPDSVIWATGGLETSLFTFLITLGFFCLSSTAVSRRLEWGGALALAAAALTRPDGALFAALAAAALLIDQPSRPGKALRLLAVTAAAWGGQLGWRLAVYGQWLPNTYWAKSAGQAWWSQGAAYLWIFFQRYWVLLVAPLLLGLEGLARRRRGEKLGAAERRALLMAAFFALGWMTYVARVGGDFMYARMLIPALPFLLLLLELGLIGLARRAAEVQVVIAALLLAIGMLSSSPVSDTEWYHGIANERQVYRQQVVEVLDARAEDLARLIDGLDVRIAFLGLEARMMDKARVPVAIECETGLTDRRIAHRRLNRRGRVGHEKRADLDYVIGERHADLIFHPSAPRVLEIERHVPLWEIRYGRLRGWILRWNPELLERLRERGAHFADFPSFLDDYIADPPDPKQVAADYPRFKLFYFDQVDDPTRQAFFAGKPR